MTGERDNRPSISPDSGASSPIFNGDQVKSLLFINPDFTPSERAQIKREAQKAVIGKTTR